MEIIYINKKYSYISKFWKKMHLCIFQECKKIYYQLVYIYREIIKCLELLH